MIQLTPQMRILVAVQPVDFRKGIDGLAPLSAKRVEPERYRCNCCDEIFKAPAPEGAGADKYDETAASMVGSLRYGLGTPFFRLEKFQAGLGIPLPVGTQWKFLLKAAGLTEPASTTWSPGWPRAT